MEHIKYDCSSEKSIQGSQSDIHISHEIKMDNGSKLNEISLTNGYKERNINCVNALEIEKKIEQKGDYAEKGISLRVHRAMYRTKEECLQIYANILGDYGKQIVPSVSYIKQFLKNCITNILAIRGEKKPHQIDVDELSKSISNEFPKVKGKRSQPIDEDRFYRHIAEFMVVRSSHHIYYETLASHIMVQRLHEITPEKIIDCAELLYNNVDVHGERCPLISDQTYRVIRNNQQKLQEVLKPERDHLFDYFGIKTLERSYLYKLHFTSYKTIERPQFMIMRVAIGIHGDDIDKVIETYNLMSDKYFTHATPTLFNAGTPKPQLSSCFLQAMEDSIESIFESLSEVAYISKWSGGIGLHISSVRSRGSLIRKTNGISDGIVPLCVVLNKVAKYINQGGKRKGSIAVYLEPWHSDIFEFCELRLNTGNDDNRARDLYLALWVPSLLIERVKSDGMWSLMCPDECPGLNLVHSQEFNELYEKYEKEGRFKRQVKARDLWKHILISQTETGFPYMLFKDSANAKSNQKNLGTIRSSNLCAEIIQYSDENETSVCNISSICLPRFITITKKEKLFDHVKLIEVCRVIVRNLDRIIDRNFYPTEKTRRSNMRHRPMGVGIQGLADVYNIMGIAFDSPEAMELNRRIFETIYYACLDESKELAKRHGSYETFEGSPFSQGILQFHMWGLNENNLTMGYDWKRLIEEIKEFGTRNSLLTALMPTASTSQIMGNSECFEPYMSNIFTRSTLAGQFIVVNKNLMRDLLEKDLWNDDMRKRLIIENGSVQNIEEIPIEIKNAYKTAFEISQKALVKQSADRGAFVDQSQSLNIFMKEPNFDILNSCLIDGHDMGLKTGIYYYRTCPAVNPINFGIDVVDIMRLTKTDNIMGIVSGMYQVDKNLPSDKTNNVEQNAVETEKNHTDVGTDRIMPHSISSTPYVMNKTITYGKKTDPVKTLIKDSIKELKTQNTNSKNSYNPDDEEEQVCKLNPDWKPGMKREDCPLCSA